MLLLSFGGVQKGDKAFAEGEKRRDEDSCARAPPGVPKALDAHDPIETRALLYSARGESLSRIIIGRSGEN